MCIIENPYKLHSGKGCYDPIIQEQKEKIETSAFQSEKLIQPPFNIHPNYHVHYLKTLTQGKNKIIHSQSVHARIVFSDLQ